MPVPMRFLLVLVILLSGPVLSRAQSSTLTGTSRSMNPAISVNGLFRGEVSRDDPSPEVNGFRIDGVEAQFSSIVDPFWSADVLIGLHPGHGDQDTGADAGHGDGMVVDVEEAYIDGRELPAGMGLRLGKFALPFGKHAPLHMHQFLFADAPAAIYTYLGDHLLSDTGVMVTLDAPLPWYSDVQVYGVSGQAEPFDSLDNGLAFGARWMNMWDLTEDATLEVGGSFLQGPDARYPGENQDVNFFGADLTWKWISSARTGGPAALVTVETVLPDYQGGGGNPWGWYALGRYRFHRNWWVGLELGQADADFESIPEWGPGAGQGLEQQADLREYKINLTFAPSEFSFLRAGMVYYEDKLTGEDDLRLIAQANFTIGSHPAHSY